MHALVLRAIAADCGGRLEALLVASSGQQWSD